MEWPRCGDLTMGPRFEGLSVTNLGFLLDRDGYQVAPNVVPARVKRANAEFALRRAPVPASVLEMVREFVQSGSGPRMVLS